MATPLLAAAVAAAIAGTFAVALPVIPKLPSCPTLTYCLTRYYADKSYTSTTGGSRVDCIGIEYSWGTPSAYRTYVEVPC